MAISADSPSSYFQSCVITLLLNLIAAKIIIQQIVEFDLCQAMKHRPEIFCKIMP
jgi:hypothetical protein